MTPLCPFLRTNWLEYWHGRLGWAETSSTGGSGKGGGRLFPPREGIIQNGNLCSLAGSPTCCLEGTGTGNSPFNSHGGYIHFDSIIIHVDCDTNFMTVTVTEEGQITQSNGIMKERRWAWADLYPTVRDVYPRHLLPTATCSAESPRNRQRYKGKGLPWPSGWLDRARRTLCQVQDFLWEELPIGSHFLPDVIWEAKRREEVGLCSQLSGSHVSQLLWVPHLLWSLLLSPCF